MVLDEVQCSSHIDDVLQPVSHAICLHLGLGKGGSPTPYLADYLVDGEVTYVRLQIVAFARLQPVGFRSQRAPRGVPPSGTIFELEPIDYYQLCRHYLLCACGWVSKCM